MKFRFELKSSAEKTNNTFNSAESYILFAIFDIAGYILALYK